MSSLARELFRLPAGYTEDELDAFDSIVSGYFNEKLTTEDNLKSILYRVMDSPYIYTGKNLPDAVVFGTYAHLVGELTELGRLSDHDDLREAIGQAIMCYLLQTGRVTSSGIRRIPKGYKPVVMTNCHNMPNDVWLEWRRNGIGGSDVAALEGVSHWKNNLDVYNNKTGVEAEIMETSNWFTLEYGHANEELIAKLFAKKSGCAVFNDERMYRHPYYPWMIADLDRMVLLPDDDTAILEIKTSTSFKREDWENNQIPVVYEYQVRHYMAVMNINKVFISCQFGNLESDNITRCIVRDEFFEDIIIETEMNFWLNNVIPLTAPTMNGDASIKLKTARKYSGVGNPDRPDMLLDSSFLGVAAQYLDAQKEKSAANAVLSEINERIKGLSLPFVEALGQTCKGVIDDGDYYIDINYKPQERTVIDSEKLKLAFPEAYNACSAVEEEYSRPFKLTRKKKGKNFTLPNP